jgi:hypothetical protein
MAKWAPAGGTGMAGATGGPPGFRAKDGRRFCLACRSATNSSMGDPSACSSSLPFNSAFSSVPPRYTIGKRARMCAFEQPEAMRSAPWESLTCYYDACW